MNDGTYDYRYASVDRLHGVETRVSVLESEIKGTLARIEARINQPQDGGLGLAMHRMLDEVPKALATISGARKSEIPYRMICLTVLAGIGLIAARNMGWHW